VDNPITVVISTLDRPEVLRRCLDAIVHGSALPAEVVVVDQSAAGTAAPEVARATAAGLAVRHVRQDRRGLSASQNLGVRTATSALVAVIDDDCVPGVEWLATACRRLQGSFPVGLVTGPVFPLPPEGNRTIAVSTRTSTTARVFTWPAMPWDVGTGGNFAVLRQRYLDVGGNDERLGTGTPGRAGNDLDLFYRLLRSGVPAAYDPGMIVHHRRSTVDERRTRRWGYGFGVGACVGKWMRGGDRYALVVLAHWIRMRARHARRTRSPEELQVLGGTVAGILYGLRLTS
jgi:GT2 family glycosyltransferase